MSAYSILIVDDDLNFLASLERLLKRRHYKIFTAENGYAAMQILKNEPVHLIVSDYMMPGMKGTELLKWALENKPQTERVLLTAHSDPPIMIEAINEAKVFRYLPKATMREDLELTIKRALDRQDLLRDLNILYSVFQRHRELLKDIPLELGEDAADIFDLLGASGTGGAKQQYSILMIDDMEKMLDVLELYLRDDLRLRLWRAADAFQGLEIMKEQYIHVVISDQMMPVMKGSEFFCHIKDKYPYSVRIMITGFATAENLLEAVNRAEIYHFLQKPFNRRDAVAIVNRALEYHDLQKMVRTLLVLFRNQKDTLLKLPAKLEKEAKDSEKVYQVTDEFDEEMFDDLVRKYNVSEDA